jgi:hypothetical protein
MVDRWSNLCRIRRIASSRAPIPFETKTMLYIIGVSFAAEMGIKGSLRKQSAA